MKNREAPTVTQQFPLHVLREYALLADGERGTLVGPRGDIAWMCAPYWDSEAVFSSLIGGAGVYAVHPAQEPFVWGGSYEAGSLVWLRDALAYPSHHQGPTRSGDWSSVCDRGIRTARQGTGQSRFPWPLPPGPVSGRLARRVSARNKGRRGHKSC